MKTRIIALITALATSVSISTIQAGVYYADPDWAYIYQGDQVAADLDGTWDHDNGSDAWDGSAIGSGLAGGVSALTEGDVKYIRIQDAVTSNPGSDPSNRKIGFTHQLTQDITQAESDEILSGPGVTLSFRARIATGSTLDDINGSPWPAGGDGYIVHDGGKDNFTIHQDSYGGDAGINLSIAFALALASDDDSLSSDGLTMNSANGDVPSADVDTGEGVVQNFLPLSNITGWHEFWITIEPDIVAASHTNKVKIWVDGNSDPLNPDGTFYVTVGNGEDEEYDYIEMGCGATGQSGAIDVDFFAYKPGLHNPVGSGLKLKPKANAGPDQEMVWPDDEATLAAEIQDDGDPNHVLKYWWEVTGQPDGSTINLDTGLGPFSIDIPGHAEPNTPYPVTPTVTVSQSGIYELKLYVRDEKSDANDTVRIFVYPEGYDNGLIAHWKLDDGIDVSPTTLTAVDSAGSYDPNFTSYDFDLKLHPGALTGEIDPGEPNWVDGLDWTDTTLLDEPKDFIGALRFDGIDDFIDVPYHPSLSLTKNFTITAWIKPNLQAGAMGIVTKVTDSSNKQYAFTIRDNGQLGIEYEASGNNYSFWGDALSDGVWQHVAVTVDNNLDVNLFINSTPAGSDTAPAEVRALTDPLCIGRWAGSYNFNYFDGVIDDVRIYNTAKTQEEIRQIAEISNTPPMVAAGSDQRVIETVSRDLVLSEATLNDPPVPNSDIEWTFTGPGNVQFDNATDLNPTATFPAGGPYGLYELTIKATDQANSSWTSSDSLWVMYQAQAQYSADLHDPMGMWKLDESGTDPDAIDSSGNGFDGPRTSTDLVDPNLPTWQPGQGKVPGGNQGALQFINSGDDVGQYVDLSVVPGTDDMTLMFWAKPAAVDYMQPLDKLPLTDPPGGAGWSARLRNQGSIMFRVGDRNDDFDNIETADNLYQADEWIHVAITFDSGTGAAIIYVNGLQAAQGTSTRTVNTIYPPMQMGYPPVANQENEYRGLLDQVRYYDIVLTPLEIARIAVED